MKNKTLCCAILTLALVCTGAHAAVTYNFTCITNNSISSAATASQFTLNVSEVVDHSNQVLFTFNNLGPVASSITDVYFYDGSLLGKAKIIDSMGVDFSAGANPNHLPGYSGKPSKVTYAADSDSPITKKGVGPNESLGILFTLTNKQNYNDVISAITRGIANQESTCSLSSLMIGIHVQGFANGASESFILTSDLPPVNDTPPTVPAPSAVMLAGVGVACLLKKRKQM